MSAIDITEAEARALLQRTLLQSRADHCEVSFRASARGNLRTARNAVSTAGMHEDHVVTVKAMFGRRSARDLPRTGDEVTDPAQRRRHAERVLRHHAQEQWISARQPEQ